MVWRPAPTGTRTWLRLRSERSYFLAVLLFVAVLLIIDEASGPNIRIGALMVALPALSAAFLGPAYVLAVVVVTLGSVALAAGENEELHTANFPVVMITAALIGAASVTAAATRRRRERQLAQVRRVAAVTQQALLRPLPERLGPLTISSMYLAADEEAAIGGDLYAAAGTDTGGARLLVGDVQGKGLAAVEVAGLLLSAFRRAARRKVPLPELPAYLDRSLRDDLDDLAEQPARVPRPGGFGATRSAQPTVGDRTVSPILERFITAVAVDVSHDGRTLQLISSGHPPPMLIHGGTVVPLDERIPGLPLGLGDLSGEPQDVESHQLAVGDILFLYTDGVIEARDSDGRFYPLAERLAGWCTRAPDDLLETLRADLVRHSGGRLWDDVAMVAVRRSA